MPVLTMHIRSAVWFASAAFTLLAAQTGSQAPAALRPDWAPNALSNVSLDPIGPGDLIDIYVADYPEISRSYRISAAGTLELPVLKKPLRVDRMMSEEIEQAVSKALVTAGLMVDPVVSIVVLEYRSKPVTLAGAVRQPITLQAIGGLRLLDAISKANGLAPEAGPEIIVSRPELNGAAAYVRHISVKELMSKPDSQLNLVLQGGEEIRVPAADKLYIVGNVKNPGAYALDQYGHLTLLQAIALCQGTLGFTQPTAIVYRSYSWATGRIEIEVPLRDIMKRRRPDFELQSNDILYIPEKSGQRLSANVIDRIVSFGAATGSGLIIWGSR